MDANLKIGQERLDLFDQGVLAQIAADSGGTSGSIYNSDANAERCLSQGGICYRLERLRRQGFLTVERRFGVKIYTLPRNGGDQRD